MHLVLSENIGGWYTLGVHEMLSDFRRTQIITKINVLALFLTINSSNDSNVFS